LIVTCPFPNQARGGNDNQRIYKEAVNLPVYPDTGAPELEATPLPSDPDIDMGMPEEMDLGMPEEMDF